MQQPDNWELSEAVAARVSGGGVSERDRLAEVIRPCSKEQSVRTIRRIGAYLL
ncbi:MULTISPECIES: hypothetical protein [Methanocalculus]|uniref:hypothetical protein n=1 Tax=Methanocalculus TaxID=71151 RepID=UPI00209E30B2|nr:hypothetical protein [Methanocalculus sp. AMF5]MCP1661427.1 hypothetical protein [Methanocalculus sp. AMF5]